MESNSVSRHRVEDISFEEIYERYYSRIYAYVSYRIIHPQDTEDAVSKIFTKVLEKRATYQHHLGNFDAWIFTIAKNTVRDYFRKKSILQFFSLEERDHLPWEHTVEEQFQLEEEKLLLRKCIHSLPKKDQQLIALRYGGELSYEDMGTILHLSTSNVGVRLHRILKTLRIKMEEEYER